MIHKNEKGLAHLGLLLLVIVLAAIGVIGYWVWQQNNENKSAKVDTPAAANDKTCQGEWYDTHTHLDNSDMPETLAERMKENDVSCSVIFVQLNEDNFDEDLELSREDLGNAPAVFVPFYDVVKNTSTQVSTQYLEKVYKETDGKLAGLGEFALYREELAGTDLTKEPWNTIYKFAADKDLFVMIHIGMDSRHLDGLKAAMKANTNTKFLIHGFEQGGDGFAQLLKDNPNMYYTLDTATFLKREGFGAHYMYPSDGGSAKQFVKDYATYKDELLTIAKKEWTQVILAAPERVMWGTDVSFDWHVDKDVYTRLIEFSEEFKASLPEDVRDKYAYQNAVKLMGNKPVYFPKVDDHGDEGDDDCDDLKEDCDKDDDHPDDSDMRN